MHHATLMKNIAYEKKEYEKYCFLIKYTTFELLDHHHELNQKKLILNEFFMLKIDSPMLKL